MQTVISRPDDACDNNKDTENLDAIADEADLLADRQSGRRERQEWIHKHDRQVGKVAL